MRQVLDHRQHRSSLLARYVRLAVLTGGPLAALWLTAFVVASGGLPVWAPVVAAAGVGGVVGLFLGLGRMSHGGLPEQKRGDRDV